MGLIEEWGTGLQRVIEKCREIGLSDPKFEDLDTAFRVSLIRSNSLKKDGKMSESVSEKDNSLKLSDKLANMDEKERNYVEVIIQHLNSNEFITSKDVVELANVSIATAKRILAKCVDLNILYSTGQTRKRKYYLAIK